MLAGEESSLAPLPFPNLGASTASAFSFNILFCLKKRPEVSSGPCLLKLELLFLTFFLLS